MILNVMDRSRRLNGRRLEALEAEWAADRPDRQTEPAEDSRPRD